MQNDYTNTGFFVLQMQNDKTSVGSKELQMQFTNPDKVKECCKCKSLSSAWRVEWLGCNNKKKQIQEE